MSRFRDTVHVGFSKDGLSEADARMWDTIGSVIVRDVMARHFDDDPERAHDAQYAAMSWKDWARDAIESGLEPPEKDDLVREWIGFVAEIQSSRRFEAGKSPSTRYCGHLFRLSARTRARGYRQGAVNRLSAVPDR
jgi:hypothetical protein